jgi:hypothetical protein
MDVTERRNRQRIVWRGTVRLLIPGWEPVDATIADISEIGWGLRLEQALHPGDDVVIDGAASMTPAWFDTAILTTAPSAPASNCGPRTDARLGSAPATAMKRIPTSPDRGGGGRSARFERNDRYRFRHVPAFDSDASAARAFHLQECRCGCQHARRIDCHVSHIDEAEQ